MSPFIVSMIISGVGLLGFVVYGVFFVIYILSKILPKNTLPSNWSMLLDKLT